MADMKVLKIVALNINSSGDNTVIAAPAAGDIKIYKMAFTAAGAVNVTFKNGTTAQSGAYVLTANGSSMFFPYDGAPWAYCDAGAAFVINLSGAVALTGQIFYTTGS